MVRMFEKATSEGALLLLEEAALRRLTFKVRLQPLTAKAADIPYRATRAPGLAGAENNTKAVQPVPKPPGRASRYRPWSLGGAIITAVNRFDDPA